MRYGIHPLAPLVLFVGRLTYQKGPDLLMQAIPSILTKRWDVQFIFAGTGDMRGYLEGMAHGLPVQFPGYVPDIDHVSLLNACDLVAIPSRNEPFGLVLTEAWSAERCVVATDVGGLSENIDNYVNGNQGGLSARFESPGGSGISSTIPSIMQETRKKPDGGK